MLSIMFLTEGFRKSLDVSLEVIERVNFLEIKIPNTNIKIPKKILPKVMGLPSTEVICVAHTFEIVSTKVSQE